MNKIRIDQLLVDQNLAPSRERAQALVLAGKVLVNEEKVQKSSQRFDPESSILRVKGPDHPYVGRGGIKLEGALKEFKVDPQGKVCVDIGASTGGFSDCLLQRGAQKVYTFDTGTNQLAYSLRQDPRIHSRENFNARHLQAQDLPEPVDLIVMDVSFISIKLIIPALLKAAPEPWEGIFLIKPQFEAGREHIEKGGIVRDEAVRQKVVQNLIDFCHDAGLEVRGRIPSPILGDKGNQEYFIYLARQ